MSQLFAKLYFDEDVDVLISVLVVAKGFSATTTLDEHQIGATDAEQLQYASDHGLTLVTHNRLDFEKLAESYHLTQKRHCGIIIAVRRPPREVSRRLLDVLNQVTADEMTNQLIYV